jgi:hypothetical protein
MIKSIKIQFECFRSFPDERDIFKLFTDHKEGNEENNFHHPDQSPLFSFCKLNKVIPLSCSAVIQQ